MMNRGSRLLLASLALLALGLAGNIPQSSALASAQAQSARRLAPPHRTAPAKVKKKASSKKTAASRASVKKGRKAAISTPPKSKHGRGSAITAYRLGHGNGGLGTIKPPAVYTAPPPAIDTGDNQQTVRVLQFGDSHTAADMFTGRMRILLQQRFGNGGAGFTFAGHPFAGYRILGTSRGQSSGWVDEGVHFTKIVNTELGLGGVANTSTREGDSVTLDAPCSQMQVQYLDQPDGGSFSVSEDGRVLSHISTDNPVAPETFEAPCGASTADTASSGGEGGSIHHFELTADSGRPVRLFGTVTEKPGITYEALGLNGAEAALILRWDQAVFTSYLKQSDPALIVLAYGTNEASNHNWTYESYSELMGRVVDTLHATAPGAAVLVIGPPDRSLRVGRRRSAHWQTFAQTVRISDAQRDVCRTHGCAFWDWRARMGGLGSMNRWAADGLAQADHTHFTSAGYVQLADRFYSDMIAAYDVWKQAHPAPSGNVSSLPPH
jgi:lysophospholipase L1-like esterase